MSLRASSGSRQKIPTRRAHGLILVISWGEHIVDREWREDAAKVTTCAVVDFDPREIGERIRHDYLPAPASAFCGPGAIAAPSCARAFSRTGG